MQEFANTKIYNFLHMDVISRYRNDPGLFREEIKSSLSSHSSLTVLIDEIQLFPEILNEVHDLIEKNRDQLRFILTGSSARKLKRNNVNLLAGRALALKLHPICSLERKINIYQALRFGCLPKMYLNDDPSENLKAYVNTYLKEEIIQEALVRKVQAFVRFLELAAQCNGKIINFTSLAKSIKVAVTTVQEYFSILVETLVAVRIDSWSFSVKKQLITAPKYYLFDCGVLNTINKTLSVPVNAGTFHFGNLFETFIVNEIIHYRDYLRKDFELNHYRTTNDEEIDLILNRGPYLPPIAIEIKSETAPKEFKHLESFAQDYPNAQLYCLSNSSNTYKVGKVKVLPWESGIAEIMEGV